MLERLQREAPLLVPNVDIQATRVIHRHVELICERSNHIPHSTQGLRTKVQSWRYDLNITLQKSVLREVVDLDGWIVGDCPPLVTSGRRKVVSRVALVSEEFDDMTA